MRLHEESVQDDIHFIILKYNSKLQSKCWEQLRMYAFLGNLEVGTGTPEIMSPVNILV